MAVEDAISEMCNVIQWLRLTGQVKQWMLFNCWDIALVVLMTLVQSGHTVVKLCSMWLEIFVTFSLLHIETNT